MSDSSLPPPPRTPSQPADAEVGAVTRALRQAVHEFEAARERREAPEKARAKRKEALTSRVSIAAISLTMLMSFLNFARAERDRAAAAANTAAANARAAAEVNWAHYQTTTAERANYLVADDALIRSVAALPDEDPRVATAHVQHIEYRTRVAAIDAENQQVFFTVQDLEQRAARSARQAAAIERSVQRYDVGARVLTLALVLLSVTLLANRKSLFWSGLVVALIGAAIAVNGYFLLF